MLQNGSRLLEVFYTQRGETVELHPGFCVDEAVVFSRPPTLNKVEPLEKMLRKKPDLSICFERSYALGDLLLLTPAINYIKAEFPEATVTLATVGRYLGLFKHWDKIGVIDRKMIPHAKFDIGFYLDGVVEKDHFGNEFSYKHRVDLYCEALGLPIPKEPVFSLPYGETERDWARTCVDTVRVEGRPVLVIQVGGTTGLKTLPFGKLMAIGTELMPDMSVIFVHDTTKEIPLADAVDLTGQTSFHELAALVDNADMVVTMDSSLLWIAHCMQTPVVALLGPNREQERMKYHRNYSVVNLAEMADCKPCFEKYTTCNGAFWCMTKPRAEDIAKKIKEAVKKHVYS